MQDLSDFPEDILSPKMDFVFKELFGTEHNKKRLIEFLKAILDIPSEEYEELTILNPIMEKQRLDEKTGVLDLHLKMKNGGRVNIEIQVLQAPHHTSRILFYLSKMINDQMKSGGKYSQLGRTISISILNYKLFPENCQ